jgi:hypothetical protein
MANNYWTKAKIKGAAKDFDAVQKIVTDTIEAAQETKPRYWIYPEGETFCEIDGDDVLFEWMTAWDKGTSVVAAIAEKLDYPISGSWNGTGQEGTFSHNS